MASLRFDLFTLFPEWFESPLRCSILGRAIEGGVIEVCLHNIRDYAADKHKVADDYPFGGGGGMVMKAEPIFAAVETVLAERNLPQKPPIILLDAAGRVFNHDVALELAHHPNLFLICGHYEGVDERVREHLATDVISVGDYVLTGGEAAAMVVMDAVSRFVPGVLGNEASPFHDSFAEGLLEHPHYTRPRVFRDWAVPDVLVSGNHQEIARWRRKESLKRTLLLRPDLLQKARLSEEDKKLLAEVQRELREKASFGQDKQDSTG